jgi:P2-related tail formation protein
MNTDSLVTDEMAAKAAAVFFGHKHAGSVAALREALEVFATILLSETVK